MNASIPQVGVGFTLRALILFLFFTLLTCLSFWSLLLALMRANPAVSGLGYRLIIIYLLGYILLPSSWGRSTPRPMKDKWEEWRKKYRGTGGDTSYPTRATDALKGDKEQNGERIKRKREWTISPATLNNLADSTTRMDQIVGLFKHPQPCPQEEL